MNKEKKFYEGANFWLSVLMLVFGGYGLTVDAASTGVALVVGVIGFVGTAREFVNNAKWIGWKAALNPAGGGNIFQYFVAVLVAVLPQVSELVPQLEGLAKAILSGNIGSIISAIITLATMTYFIFKGGKPALATK